MRDALVLLLPSKQAIFNSLKNYSVFRLCLRVLQKEKILHFVSLSFHVLSHILLVLQCTLIPSCCVSSMLPFPFVCREFILPCPGFVHSACYLQMNGRVQINQTDAADTCMLVKFHLMYWCTSYESPGLDYICSTTKTTSLGTPYTTKYQTSSSFCSMPTQKIPQQFHLIPRFAKCS